MIFSFRMPPVVNNKRFTVTCCTGIVKMNLCKLSVSNFQMRVVFYFLVMMLICLQGQVNTDVKKILSPWDTGRIETVAQNFQCILLKY